LNGGGSYIRIDASAIESATAGEYRTKAGHYGRKASASEKVTLPVFPVMEPGEQSLRFAFPGADSVSQSMDWMTNQPYSITDSNGKILSTGTVDSSGRFPKIVLPESDTLNLIIGRETWSKEELSFSSTEDDSMEYFEDEAPDADLYLSEMDSEDDRTSSLTEPMIATLLNLTKVS
ncbi:type VI secretion system tip protein VgrG, partial [Citrobacter braakii]|nr:type VI secretion system tip protein VgrG [Citrobacter braakii]